METTASSGHVLGRIRTMQRLHKPCKQFSNMNPKTPCEVDDAGRSVQDFSTQVQISKDDISPQDDPNVLKYPHGTVIKYSALSSYVCINGRQVYYMDLHAITPDTDSNRIVFTMVRFG